MAIDNDFVLIADLYKYYQKDMQNRKRSVLLMQNGANDTRFRGIGAHAIASLTRSCQPSVRHTVRWKVVPAAVFILWRVHQHPRFWQPRI